jgi:hypothetical protein
MYCLFFLYIPKRTFKCLFRLTILLYLCCIGISKKILFARVYGRILIYSKCISYAYFSSRYEGGYLKS